MGWPLPETWQAQHLPVSFPLKHSLLPLGSGNTPAGLHYPTQRPPATHLEVEPPGSDSGQGPSAGKPGDDRPDSVCDVFTGQPQGPKSAQSKGWSAEKKSNCVQRVPQGLKFLLIQTGSKLRNHFRGAEAIVADLWGCCMAKFLSSPKRYMVYPHPPAASALVSGEPHCSNTPDTSSHWDSQRFWVEDRTALYRWGNVPMATPQWLPVQGVTPLLRNHTLGHLGRGMINQSCHTWLISVL